MAIGEGLRQNHTVLGIHMLGNEAIVDALGFVQPSSGEEFDYNVKSHIFTRIKRKLTH